MTSGQELGWIKTLTRSTSQELLSALTIRLGFRAKTSKVLVFEFKPLSFKTRGPKHEY